MAAGGGTYINEMLCWAGFQNVFETQPRYPMVNPDELRRSGCRVILLSSEPYPFVEKHVAELTDLLPGITPVLVDGELFSWYGSRMLLAPPYFRKLKAFVEEMLG